MMTYMEREGMVDIHSHILPGLDDGARDWDQTLAMCQMALSDGITTMVATPHILAEVFENTPEGIRERFEELQKRMEREVMGLTTLPGSETHLDLRILDWLKDGSLQTLNRGRYLLLELPTTVFPPGLDRFLDRLLEGGIIPVIAHPERNLGVQADPNKLYPLVQRGVLAQVTAQSLTGEFGRQAGRCADILLRCHLCHVIATDAHSTTGRPPRLQAGVEKASAVVGSALACAMATSIPAAIVRNEPVQVPPPARYQPRFRWFG
jgi:protein-tyrosine phosphatase